MGSGCAGMGSRRGRDPPGQAARGPAVPFPVPVFPSHLAGQEGEAVVGAEQRPRDGAAAVPAALPGARRLLEHPLPCGDRHWVRGSERPEPPQNPRPPPRPYLGARGRSGGGRPGPRSWRRDFGRAGPERRGRSGPGKSPERPARLRHPALHSGIPPSLGIRAPASRPSGPGIPLIPTPRIPAFRPAPSRYRRWERGGARGRELRRRTGTGGGLRHPRSSVLGWGYRPGHPVRDGRFWGPASAAQCGGTPKPRRQRCGRGPGAPPGTRREKLLGDSRQKHGAFPSQHSTGSQAKLGPSLPRRAPYPTAGSRWMVAPGLPVPALGATRAPGTPKPEAAEVAVPARGRINPDTSQAHGNPSSSSDFWCISPQIFGAVPALEAAARAPQFSSCSRSTWRRFPGARKSFWLWHLADERNFLEALSPELLQARTGSVEAMAGGKILEENHQRWSWARSVCPQCREEGKTGSWERKSQCQKSQGNCSGGPIFHDPCPTTPKPLFPLSFKASASRWSMLGFILNFVLRLRYQREPWDAAGKKTSKDRQKQEGKAV